MVEFGLKLEDNKVSEWSERYIDYEALKKILKKAKKSEKKYGETYEENPTEAKAITKAYRSGAYSDMKDVSLTTRDVSSLTKLTKRGSISTILSESTEECRADGDKETGQASEKTALLKRQDANETYKATSIVDALSGMAINILNASDDSTKFERKMRNNLEEIDNHVSAFDDLFNEQQKKIVCFYYSQLQELQERLESIVDWVHRDQALGKTLSEFDSEGITGATTSEKRSSIGEKVEELIMQLADSVRSIGNENENENGNLYEMKVKKSIVTDEDDEDNEDDPNWDTEHVLKAATIRRSLTDQYRLAKLLQNYAMMNITGFVKIVKKFDKTVPSENGRFKDALEIHNMLNDAKAVETLSNKYEKYFANWFCSGDLREAKAQMLTKRGDGLDMDWSQLQLGYRMGMSAILALWVCWDLIWGMVAYGKTTIGARHAFPVFRGCGGLLLLQWFWGFSVFMWTRYRVNYIFLFDFNPRIVRTPKEIISDAVDNTLSYLVLMLLYYKAGAHDIPQVIPPGGYPLILVFGTTWKLVFPLKTRIPMWQTIFRVVTAPCHAPTFFQTYVGDIFTSLVKVLVDLSWTFFWVLSGDFLLAERTTEDHLGHWSNTHFYKNVLIPIICMLPLVFRFNQCLRKYVDSGDRFPHLVNASKYALSQLVTLTGAFHPLYMEVASKKGRVGRESVYQIFWTFLFFASSIFSFSWDVYMDWGLGRKKYDFLGPRLMYPKKYVYYITIAMDLVLRSLWVLTLLPPSSGARFALPAYMYSLQVILELFRRTIWGFFRLENEHRSNVNRYRRVDFVPLHFDTGHNKHMHKDKMERSGISVLREVILVTLVVVGFCIASIISAQRANKATSVMVEL
mmetsp:Transcript_19151/g.41593  ORF Transcript_19151/g.41593 Transcript_19151/m.41593 type:complete len:856 (+) Transcript_19151:75-2642(+)